MNKCFVLVVFTLLSFSCSNIRLIKNKKITETVSINDGLTKQPYINEKIATDIYGPMASGSLPQNEKKTQQQRKPVIALDLVPALYASFNYIALLQELERKKIYPSLINTSDFTSVVAVLYAKYKNANKVEWSLFSLIKKIKGEVAYGKEWSAEIIKFLEKEFGPTRIEQLNILVTLNTGKKRNKLVKTGRIVDVIGHSIKINKPDNFVNNPHLLYQPELRKLGVDKLYTVNALPSNVSLKASEGFTWGVYRKLFGMYAQDEKVLVIKNINRAIDIIPNLSDMFISARQDALLIANKISKDNEEWIIKNN